MIDREMLIKAFARDVELIKRETTGISDAESLIQPPFHSNSLNWTVGHLAENRNSILKALGQPPVLSDEQDARYGYGSQPVTCQSPDVVLLHELLAAIEASQVGIVAGLRQATPEALAQEGKFAARTMTLGERVFFQYYHEVLHAGQLEMLREMIAAQRK